MLPDERLEAKAGLAAAHQKLFEIIAEDEAEGIDLQTICQIASVQADLHSAALSMLRCQLRTSLRMIFNSDNLNPVGEKKKLIEQYQAWLTFTS